MIPVEENTFRDDIITKGLWRRVVLLTSRRNQRNKTKFRNKFHR